MLTLATSPELENRLAQEAAKRGLLAPEYALRLIQSFMQPVVGDAEAARLSAIDELMGAAAGTSFSSEDLRRERNADRDFEERHVQRIHREAVT